jgi:hypothetical protein
VTAVGFLQILHPWQPDVAKTGDAVVMIARLCQPAVATDDAVAMSVPP